MEAPQDAGSASRGTPVEALVTGATSGIGKEVARALLRRGITVGIVARQPEKGERVAAELAAAGGKVELLVADLALQSEVRRLAAQARQRLPRLAVLVNNAGALFGERQVTADGIESTFALNHLGYFLLTRELEPVLRANHPARIVNVASAVHSTARLDFDDLMSERGYSAMRAYARSKLANVVFTYELARRLDPSAVTANCLHPGVVATGFGRGGGATFSTLYEVGKPFMRSPERGADTAVWLATDLALAGVSGRYFVDRRAVRSSDASYDLELGRRLWQASERLVDRG